MSERGIIRRIVLAEERAFESFWALLRLCPDFIVFLIFSTNVSGGEHLMVKMEVIWAFLGIDWISKHVKPVEESDLGVWSMGIEVWTDPSCSKDEG